MTLSRAILVSAFCGGLSATAGCVRSDDGSYELRNRPHLPSLMAGSERQFGRNTRDVYARADYPRPPVRASGRPLKEKAAMTEAWRPEPVARPRLQVSAAASAIRCRNEASAGGRVRVVCD